MLSWPLREQHRLVVQQLQRSVHRRVLLPRWLHQQSTRNLRERQLLLSHWHHVSSASIKRLLQHSGECGGMETYGPGQVLDQRGVRERRAEAPP